MNPDIILIGAFINLGITVLSGILEMNDSAGAFGSASVILIMIWASLVFSKRKEKPWNYQMIQKKQPRK